LPAIESVSRARPPLPARLGLLRNPKCSRVILPPLPCQKSFPTHRVSRLNGWREVGFGGQIPGFGTVEAGFPMPTGSAWLRVKCTIPRTARSSSAPGNGSTRTVTRWRHPPSSGQQLLLPPRPFPKARRSRNAPLFQLRQIDPGGAGCHALPHKIECAWNQAWLQAAAAVLLLFGLIDD
jgi:hypothetical protein